ncbi:MAG: tRNA (adenosine(37)-N6)-threonylcarbamoyltransferase complex transferase subunit TsaD [Candidatus Acidulodesulfobacterium acidiphilum]|uniref:tRNA N6-adenosine threonylcarbamoyltransferase n=1 Tax=Candidatus Acidulodesulfobacterium acidiphilum TaxID=2597224 RepID=A0A520XAQ3_9DELT|nr:MAG: tRNA (adenosine(37)-N6)-threonylcarbamoyltransferase complex transferase subunit TsaD [Candidatus Acidulodesulfobacterium acidiphilum]
MINLAFESSCDDFSCAVLLKENSGKDGIKIKILSNIIYSQDYVHGIYGGVVPELASRNHIKAFLPAFRIALSEAKISMEDVGFVSATAGPGLVGSLLIGLMCAKTISYALNIPIVPVNHIEGHIFSPFLEIQETEEIFPFAALVISGGHTHLYLVNSHNDIRLIGRTKDDACGELFDKVSNYLGFGYPGGRIVDELAEKGDKQAFKFPLPMIHSKDLYMSFSGLKTAVINKIDENGGPKNIRENVVYDILASLREAVSEILFKKTFEACKAFKIKNVLVSGGVSANSRIRSMFKERGYESGLKIFFPSVKYTTDNAAMIGYAGFFKNAIDPSALRSEFLDINADPSWEL